MAPELTRQSSEEATVLLVDDEPRVLSTVRRVLLHFGYNVLATSEPTKALEILNVSNVDVLIADLMMPGMSGTELVAAAREHHPHVVRIVLTGCSSIQETEKLINDGEVHRFLTKPFKAQELRSVLEQALARRDELHRTTMAGRASTLRARMLADLEREHPGITEIDKNEQGVYMLNRRRLAYLEIKLKASCLSELGRLLP